VKRMIQASLVAVLAAAAVPKTAHADPRCTSALTMVAFTGYLDCRGSFVGNINGSASEMTTLTGFGGVWDAIWTWAGKSDDALHGPFTGGPGAGPTGTVFFDEAVSGKFVIGIKQCNAYSYYLFDAESPLSSVAVDSRGTCDNDGFSHVALYLDPPSGDLPLNDLGDQLAVTPEPASLTLLGTGLVAMVGVARRRRKQR
jgi:hypothetical protein